MRIVEVTWEDALSELGHMVAEVATDMKPPLRKSYGCLLCDTGDKLNLCAGIILNDDGSLNSVSDVLTIPRVNVKTIRVLETTLEDVL